MTDEPQTAAAPRRRFDLRQPRVRGGAVVAVALVVAVGVWLAVRGGGSGSSSQPPVPVSSTAVPISISGLTTLASAVGQPIYWAGAEAGKQYELTRSRDGRVWIRYLPRDAKVGERSTPYLTVGTYPVANAFAATRSVAGEQGSTRVNAGGGAVAFYSSTHPTSVYVAYPGSNYQIEVFDPTAGEARSLVASGKIRLVPGSSTSKAQPTGAVALTEQQLKQRASAGSAPIYWVGPQPDVHYELTQTSNGRTYVRYLPQNAAAGSQTPYLTVGTYPVKDAFSVTQAAAKTSGNVTLKVRGGGVGFYNESSPSNVHLAYPGKAYQIEVFDPSPQRARELASSGRLRPVG